jgi:hypothetical protein
MLALGGSQGDLAVLKGEDVDWNNGTISFFRKKTCVSGSGAFGQGGSESPEGLPAEGLLFLYLSRVRAGDRATELTLDLTLLRIGDIFH